MIHLSVYGSGRKASVESPILLYYWDYISACLLLGQPLSAAGISL